MAAPPHAESSSSMESIPPEILSLYEPINRVGEGQYGEVFEARDRATNEKVALKKNKNSNEKDGV